MCLVVGPGVVGSFEVADCRTGRRVVGSGSFGGNYALPALGADRLDDHSEQPRSILAVAFDGLLLRPGTLSYCVIADLVGTVVTFVLLGRKRLAGTEEQAAVRVSPVTVPWMILLWGLSGMCMSAQAVGTFLEPGQSSAYMWGSSLAMVVLLARPWRWGASHWSPYREEVLIGVLWGLFYALGPVMFLQALVELPAAVVYPLAVAGPAVLMVPIGALIYQQPMGKYGLIGTLLGICSILAIAFG